MIESGAVKSSDKEYSDGAEVTKDTAKVFGCPMILKVGPPTLAEIAMMNNSYPIQNDAESFEALSKKR
jgi:alanine dehydrogenase